MSGTPSPSDRGPGERGALRSLVAPIYLPTVLESAGESALLPVLPFLALGLGFSVPGAAALTLILGVAAVLGPIPVGRLMGAVGTRRAIVGSGIALAVCDVAAMLVVRDGLDGGAGTAHRAGLVAALVVVAATSQVWALGRQSYLGTRLPPALRARGMTAFGGMLRVGQVLGPLAGAAVLGLGHEAWVFGLFAVLTAVATTLVAVSMVPGEELAGAAVPAVARAESAAAPGAAPEHDAAVPPPGRVRADPGPREVLRTMLRVALGVGPLIMGRINRPVIVPLLGASLGVDAGTISVIFGVCAVLEVVMFVPAGLVMERWGRAAAAVPCSLALGVGYLALAAAASAVGAGSPTAAVAALAVPSLLIAVGNGLGSGIVMTLGIDLSPERGRTRYLSWWNTLAGTGRLAAPLLVAAITLVAPIGAAGAASGVLCLLGAAWLARAMPRLGLGRPGTGRGAGPYAVP
ncbi:MFS transporter [Brachybacterium huguangmaarense]